MTEEIEKKSLEVKVTETQGTQEQALADETVPVSVNQQEEANATQERRGRVIAGGLVATVILAVIAMIVAGIFQITAKWLIVCPKDLTVNDPAPVLWKDIIADKTSSKGLGVSEKLLNDASLKLEGPK